MHFQKSVIIFRLVGCLSEAGLYKDPHGLQPFRGGWLFVSSLGELQAYARKCLQGG